jgi:hypothetical protein
MPAESFTRRHRLSVLERRAFLGQQLFHADDLVLIGPPRHRARHKRRRV